MRLLLDEMYPEALAARCHAVGIEACRVATLSLAGHADAEVFADAVSGGYTVLTENVADFTRIAAEHISAGKHHHGLLVALSSRFSRRPAGIAVLVAALEAVAGESLDDRVVFLRRVCR